MTEQNITAVIWMLPVALAINAIGFYAVVKMALTGQALITRKHEDDREPMRGIHDFGGRR